MALLSNCSQLIKTRRKDWFLHCWSVAKVLPCWDDVETFATDRSHFGQVNKYMKTKRVWIKLYLEILDDDEFGTLPEFMKWRAIELFLVSGENGNDGRQETMEKMARFIAKQLDSHFRYSTWM